ncbi:hypothetical protein [Hoeflea sp. TYP-13]|uniref:hypothetical protein n=1 Tax=Hoeflea sp. TYP-13 TaxID=3230023 RepID=UPI0034C61BBB
MSKDHPANQEKETRWTVQRMALLAYPFAAGAVAINIFFIGLMAQAIGLDALTPLQSIGLGLVGGVPAAWWFAGKIRGLMDEADGIDRS